MGVVFLSFILYRLDLGGRRRERILRRIALLSNWTVLFLRIMTAESSSFNLQGTRYRNILAQEKANSHHQLGNPDLLHPKRLDLPEGLGDKIHLAFASRCSKGAYLKVYIGGKGGKVSNISLHMMSFVCSRIGNEGLI